MTAAAFAESVRKAYMANRHVAMAEPMSKYMRNRFAFAGLPAPKQAEILAPLLKAAKPYCSEAFVTSAACALWKRKEREFHYAGAILLYKHRKSLTPASLPVLRHLIQTHSWWDTVDALSTRTVGPLVLRYPKLKAEMDAWSVDENFWVRRCAILHQLSFKEQTDVERLFEYCAHNARDTEFFIRKAIGWALRQYAKTDAKAVLRFVESHPELSPLSRREALKHFV